MNNSSYQEFKGINGTLILTETGVIIKRGFKGFFFGGGTIRGDKTIPFTSIVAVQFKKAGMLSGQLQLSLKGGNEANAGFFESVKDENTISFNNNKNFELAKKIIEDKINTPQDKNLNNGIDDLEKLAKLRDSGIITEEEFTAKKKQILNL